MNRTRIAALVAMLPTCFVTRVASGSDQPQDPGVPTASAAVLVHLPAKLGGGERLAGLAPPGKPKHLFGLGRNRPGRRPSGPGPVSPQVAPPPSADVSQYAPAPGDQGQTGSCAAFATGYSAMGWWANQSGLGGVPFAPMFLYAQEVQGACDQGSDCGFRPS